jgi:hypothetical protein
VVGVYRGLEEALDLRSRLQTLDRSIPAHRHPRDEIAGGDSGAAEGAERLDEVIEESGDLARDGSSTH